MNRNAFKKIAFAALVAVLVIAGSIFLQTRGEKSVGAAPAQAAGTASGFVAPGVPKHLSIPSIGVDTSIQSVGLAKDGSLGVPSNCSSSAWYDKGPRPGFPGNAVIDGHLECIHTPKAVFYSLGDLASGDKIYVTDDQGVTRTFTVASVKDYPYDADTAPLFQSSDSSSHLVLITCAGNWMEDKKLYDKRVVVTADLENDGE